MVSNTTTKAVKKSFDEMFGEAPEFVPNPTDLVEGDFTSLDEEEGEGEEELTDMDCTDLAPADTDSENSDYDEADLENLCSDETPVAEELSGLTTLADAE